MLLKNKFSPIKFGTGKQHEMLDVFCKTSGKKNIIIDSDSCVKYVVVLNNSDIDISFDIVGSNSDLELFGIFVGNVKSDVVTSVLSNLSSANVNIFSIVKDSSDMQINGSIVIGKNVENVEGHLKEEQFLLGNPNNLVVRPILDVNSHLVKASHSAKIHTLDQHKLFYMMSKGLSLEDAQKMVIQAGLQFVFDSVSSIDQDEKNKILDEIIKSSFNS